MGWCAFLCSWEQDAFGDTGCAARWMKKVRTVTELNDGPAREHLLLTVLGKDPKPAQYTLADRRAEAQLAPIALFDLLPEAKRPDRVLALCTLEAR